MNEGTSLISCEHIIPEIMDSGSWTRNQYWLYGANYYSSQPHFSVSIYNASLAEKIKTLGLISGVAEFKEMCAGIKLIIYPPVAVAR